VLVHGPVWVTFGWAEGARFGRSSGGYGIGGVVGLGRWGVGVSTRPGPGGWCLVVGLGGTCGRAGRSVVVGAGVVVGGLYVGLVRSGV